MYLLLFFDKMSRLLMEFAGELNASDMPNINFCETTRFGKLVAYQIVVKRLHIRYMENNNFRYRFIKEKISY